MAPSTHAAPTPSAIATADWFDALHREQQRTNELLEQVLEVLRESSHAPAPDRHAQLLRALVAAMQEAAEDVFFDAAEVLEVAAADHGLSVALASSRVRSTAALGAMLRSLRGRSHAGVTLERSGAGWCLRRT